MSTILSAFRSLEDYLESVGYKGYDCYDALNSPILSALSLKTKPLRIAYIQLLKILPFNLRPLLGVPKGFNPKGLGLLLSASSQLYAFTRQRNYLKKLTHLSNLLLQSQSQSYSGNCWGYNFDWQSRVFFVPRFTPTIVNTAYVAHGFLDAHEAAGEAEYLKIARSACDFILNDLHRSEENGALCFSYTPIDRLKVYNASILGAALLARVARLTGEAVLLATARSAVDYVMHHQNDDGSWYYADTYVQKWIDSFHTGFILESLDRYIGASDDRRYESHLEKGYRFYVEHFFLESGVPKYFHNVTYPIDIHSAAQGIVTLIKLKRLHPESEATLNRLIRWTLSHMQSRKGYFYFQKRKLFTNKIPYIRWSQSWMYYAMTHYIRDARIQLTEPS